MIEHQEIIIRLGVSAFCAGLIGLERERKEWTAGMRTHMMVGVGATLYMLVSSYGFQDLLSHEKIDLDPSRVAAQVVSGIGFLGAGTIIFLRQGIIRGLTTASGLWTVAGIGLAIGGGLYLAGIATTCIAIVILWILQPIESKLYKRNRAKVLIVRLSAVKKSDDLLHTILHKQEFSGMDFTIEKQEGEVVLIIKSPKLKILKNIAFDLQGHEYVKSIEIDGN